MVDKTELDLMKLSTEQLESLRADTERFVQKQRDWLRTIVKEINNRHRAAQLRARYAKAADLLLAVMPVDTIYEKLDELIRTGALVEKTTAVPLTEQANVTLK